MLLHKNNRSRSIPLPLEVLIRDVSVGLQKTTKSQPSRDSLSLVENLIGMGPGGSDGDQRLGDTEHSPPPYSALPLSMNDDSGLTESLRSPKHPEKMVDVESAVRVKAGPVPLASQVTPIHPDGFMYPEIYVSLSFSRTKENQESNGAVTGESEAEETKANSNFVRVEENGGIESRGTPICHGLVDGTDQCTIEVQNPERSRASVMEIGMEFFSLQEADPCRDGYAGGGSPGEDHRREKHPGYEEEKYQGYEEEKHQGYKERLQGYKERLQGYKERLQGYGEENNQEEESS
jgi:hypothetical protein